MRLGRPKIIPPAEVASVRDRRTSVKVLEPRPPKIVIGERLHLTVDEAIELRDNLTALLKELGR